MLVWGVISLLVFGVCGELQNTGVKSEIVLRRMYGCFQKIYPEELRCERTFNNFMNYTSPQNDPYTMKNYIHWPVYDGPDDWTAMCHMTASLKECLDPIFCKHPEEFIQYPDIDGLYEICKYKDLLTDLENNHATCIHQNLLNDQVLKCYNVITLLLMGAYYYSDEVHIWSVYKNEIIRSIFSCFYVNGEWRQNCGPQVDAMMHELVEKYTETYNNAGLYIMKHYDRYPSCNPCSTVSNTSLYTEFNKQKMNLVNASFGFPGVYLKSNKCSIASYPLSRCHMQETFKQDSLGAFCENIEQKFIPIVSPHLPLCDLQQFVGSSRRVCSLSYNEFVEIISHIPACIDDEDELFHCYRGYNPDLLHFTLLTAGHYMPGKWCGKSLKAEDVQLRNKIYPITRQCTKERYKYLAEKCTHGEPVVQMIQDLRVILGIDLGSASRITDKKFLLMLNESYREKHEFLYSVGPC